MRNEVFLDTSYAIALVLRRDDHHERAARLAHELLRSTARITTTSAILLELGNALARNSFRPLAIRLIDQIQNDPAFTVATVDEPRLRTGYDLFVRHSDKSWTLVDCISFVVMQERGISEALTADRHFVQAGFRALLLDDG